jgi:hypothetical protein
MPDIDMPSSAVARDSGLIWNEGQIDAGIDAAILSVNVSYSMSLCAQVNVTVHDPAFHLAKNNFFWVTRDVWYRSKQIMAFEDPLFSGQTSYLTQAFEIGRSSLGPSQGAGAVWSLELRTKAIQQMKRDRGNMANPKGDPAGDIPGVGHVYAINAARKYGLVPVVEETTKGDDSVQTIQPFNPDPTGSGEGQEGTSVWDALKAMASAAKFVTFEADGQLFFCSHKFLLGKWGTSSTRVRVMNPETNTRHSMLAAYCPAQWPTDKGAIIQVLAVPTLSKSDNDPFEVQGSMIVDRTNGMSLRPGMTIQMQGIPMFGPAMDGTDDGHSGLYLITNVDYDHLGTQPVKVSFTSPTRERHYIAWQKVHNNPSLSPGTMRSANAGSGRQ